MSEEMSAIVETLEKDEKQPNKGKKDNILAIGCDIGTMNICCSKNNTNEVIITRNVFLPLNKDDITISELSDISYIESEDGDLFIIGEDAFRFANIFNQTVSRPMENGLISPKEIAAIDILTMILKNIIGDTKNYETYCSYSIPAQAIDQERSVTYHEKVFGRILSSLGVNHTSVNEGSAIIYSECQKEKFSGVGISFGAGMCNVSVMFKGIEVLLFSTARSGDYIDKSVGESLGLVSNRVTSIKEKYLNLEKGFLNEKNKKIRRVLEALEYYYDALINYTIKQIIKQFDEKVNIEVDENLPIVISGGTSLPPGFIDLFKSVLSKHELPFEVSEVRAARNPLTCVSQGLLIKTLADVGGK